MSNKKFIILFTTRSGSTLMRMCLDHHKKVSVFPELFTKNNHKFKPIFYRDFKPLNFKKYNNENKLIRAYMDKIFNEIPPNESEIVGFKISVHQMIPGFRNYVSQEKPIMIHLTRKNILKKIVSFETARKRKKFHFFSDDGIPKIQVSLNTSNIINDIKKIEQEYNFVYNNYKKGFEYYRITYEDFTSNIFDQTNKILNFLGASSLRSLDIPLKKINPDNIRNVVSNYNQLEKTLRGTKYEKYLD